MEKNVVWIVAAVTRFAIADLVTTFTGILMVRIGRGATSELDPVDFGLTCIIVAVPGIARSRIGA